MKPYDFTWTRFYEANSEFTCTGLELDLTANELIFCSTIIDKDNFSILTTKRLMTQLAGRLYAANIRGAVDKLYGDFKGYQDKAFTFGLVQLQNGKELKYFIETGKASMVMIYGVRTFIETNRGRTNKLLPGQQHTGQLSFVDLLLVDRNDSPQPGAEPLHRR